jgi:FAD/FMN-containing dehydrogenase
MRRREFLATTALGAVQLAIGAGAITAPLPDPKDVRRVRPGEPGWPTDQQWKSLSDQVGGRLVKVTPTLDSCVNDPTGDRCTQVFKELRNPYFIGDDYSLTQTCGWLNAWRAQPSAYVVIAESASDVASAIKFAMRHNLRLVVRGGGHSYLGTSTAPDSLMVWTRKIRDIMIRDSFIPMGAPDDTPPLLAVTVGAGAIWIHVYDAVTTRHKRYVQGGGCATVGVGGFILGGGFGSYSKKYGTGAASLLEAEVVTADGEVRIANRWRNSDLFWALKGGGGGTFGVVTRLTLQTHELPKTFGWTSLKVEAKSEQAYRQLVDHWLEFYASNLHNEHWGECVNLVPTFILDVDLSFQGLVEDEVRSLWRPFIDWVSARPGDYTFTDDFYVRVIPAETRWDIEAFKKRASKAIRMDDRPNAPADNAFWSANISEAGHFIHDFESLWLSATLLDPKRRLALADRLAAAAAHSKVEVHLQKGLAGGDTHAIAAVRDTSMNTKVLDAFAMAIMGSEEGPGFVGMPGHEPDLRSAAASAKRVAAGMAELRKLDPDGGAYVAESSYFEPNWQRSYWGGHYRQLRAIKENYDPKGLFYVHHGVGTEGWSADGFARTG